MYTYFKISIIFNVKLWVGFYVLLLLFPCNVCKLSPKYQSLAFICFSDVFLIINPIYYQ